MHELTLAANLLELSEEHAARSGLTRVVRVHLALGALALVDEDALRFAFEVAREGTVAASADLHIEHVAGRASCSACGQDGATFEVTLRGEPCPRCGARACKLIAGDELRLTVLEGT